MARGWGAVAAAVLLATGAGVAPALAAPPANDERVDARTVTVPSKIDGTTVDATEQPNDPFSDCSDVTNSVWYALDPATTQAVTIELRAQGDLEPVIDVYRRDRSNLEELDCDTGDRRGRASVAFRAEQGERYLVRVGQERGSEPGAFSLELFSPEPEARPPGPLLPRRGGRATVDRARDLTDAWSKRLAAGRPYVVVLASRSDACPGVEVYPPGVGSFDGAELTAQRCNRHRLFTPERSGRYSFLVRAGRGAPGEQRYRLRVRPATRDDTAPGRTIGNYQRVRGRVGAGSGDVVDLLRFHVARRSDVNLRFSGSGLRLELRGIRGRPIASANDTSLHTRLKRGRYYAVVRSSRDGGGSRYRLQPQIRQITRAHIAINGRFQAVIAPGQAATVGVVVTPPSSGHVIIRVERLDPLEGYQFHRRFRVPTSSGRVSATFVPRLPGRFRATAEYSGSRTAAPSETRWAYVSAREPF